MCRKSVFFSTCGGGYFLAAYFQNVSRNVNRSTGPRVHVAWSKLIAYYLREPSRETKKHPSVIILAVHESGPRVGSTRQEKKFGASNENTEIYDFDR